MKSNKKLLIVFLLVLNSIGILHANYAFYRKVTSTCKTYHVDITSDNMQLNMDSNNFTINLTSRRNNFEMIMIIGFAAAGQAIIHQKHLQGTINNYNPIIPAQVSVFVTVPMGRGDTIFSAEANAFLVQELADGSLDTAEFMIEIKDSIQTL